MTEIARMTAPPPPANLFGEAWPRWRLPVTAFGALAAAIFVAGRAASIEEGIGIAAEAIDLGSAFATFERLKVLSAGGE